MDTENGEKDFLRRPTPTYQHYVDHFEKLYRQSPLAKVIIQDLHPKLSQSAECKASGRSPSQAGPFKVPLTPQVLTPKSASTGTNVMSPVAQLFQQMQKGGGKTTRLHSSGDHGLIESPSFATSVQQQQKKLYVEQLAADKENLGKDKDAAKHQEDQMMGVDTVEAELLGSLEDGEEIEQHEDEVDDVVEGCHDDVIGEDYGREQGVEEDGEQKSSCEVTYKDEESEVRQESCYNKNEAIKQPAQMAISNDTPNNRDHGTAREAKEHTNSSWEETPKTSKKNETVIDEWIVKWLGSSWKHISVEGHREEDPEGSFWHSTAICNRLSNRLLETSSGSRYRLQGSMNKLLTLEQGFSKSFVKRFERGFPPAWKELIAQEATRLADAANGDTVIDPRKHIKSASSKQSASKKQATTKKPSQQDLTKQRQETSKKQSQPDFTKESKQVATKESKKSEQTPTNKKMERDGRVNISIHNLKAKAGEKKTPTLKKNVAIVVTPICIHVDKVRKTASGRKVIPPLQYWTGQRQRSIALLDGATEILEGTKDYTPVSATSVRLTGSIDISERTKRKYNRKEESGKSKSWKRRNARLGDQETSDSDIATSCDTDSKKTSSQKEGDIICIRRKTSNRNCKTSSSKNDKAGDTQSTKVSMMLDTPDLSPDTSNSSSRRKNSETDFQKRISARNLAVKSSRKCSTRLEPETSDTLTDAESCSENRADSRTRNGRRISARNRVTKISEKDASSAHKDDHGREAKQASSQKRQSLRHKGDRNADIVTKTASSDPRKPNLSEKGIRASDRSEDEAVRNSRDMSQSESKQSTNTQENTDSDGYVERNNGRISPGKMQKTSQEIKNGLDKSHQNSRSGASYVKRNPYDLYGAVMNVVEAHRHNREMMYSSRRHSHEGKANQTFGTKASGECPQTHDAEASRNDSYAISDDEDLSSENSAFRRSSKVGQRVTPKSAEVLQARNQSSSSESPHRAVGGAVQGTGHSKVPFRSRRHRLDTSKVLLGSNMLPETYSKKLVNQPKHNDPQPKDVKYDKRAGVTREKTKKKVEVTDEKYNEPSKETAKSTRKPKSQVSKKKAILVEEEGEKWEPDELQRLHKALKVIPPSSQQFWLRVAAMVGTRTEWECQETHQAGLEGIQTSKTMIKSTAKASKVEPVSLTATKGTMRRKRQLKEFIQQHNQNADDDLFDSTPFKKQKMTSKTLGNLVLEDEDEDDDFTLKPQGSARLKTPSTRLRTLLNPLSAKKTPHSGFVSPGLIHSVETKYMDQYIHGMQKKRPGGRGRVRRTPQSPPKPKPQSVRLEASAVNVSSGDIFNVDPIVVEHDDDEEDGEADYYWSDEDQ